MNMSDITRPEFAAAPALRGELRANEPMARHVSWRTGGSAARAYVPVDLDDLAAFLRALPAGEPLLLVGLGSNLLVRDGGFAGTVVFVHGVLDGLRLDSDAAIAAAAASGGSGIVYAEAGVASPKVARFAANHDLVGAEFLAGIPGTFGGALAMNAGCYGGETWNLVERVRVLDRRGQVRERMPSEFEIGYRHVRNLAADDELFVGAWLRLRCGDGRASRARIKELLEKRIASQPLQLPNAGSVFRNPPGDHAARLIEAAGLKGFAIGGARISERHANFIVNPAGAGTAADIEALIDHAQRAVREQFGIELVREVRIVGERT
jgi:UDP-N-acetylmuramate dehydrogenase